MPDPSDFGQGEFGGGEFGGQGDAGAGGPPGSEPGGVVDVPPVVVQYPYRVITI